MRFRSITGSALVVLLLTGTAAMASDGMAAPRSGAHSAAPVRHSGLPGVFEERCRSAVAARPGGRPAGDRSRRADPQAQRHDRGTEFPGPADAGADAQDAGRQRVPLPGTRRQGPGRGRRQQEERRHAASRPRTRRRADGTSGSNDDAAAAGADDGNTRCRDGGFQDSGTEPADLGTITVDKDGNIDGGTVGKPVDLLGGRTGRRTARRLRHCRRPTIRRSSIATPTSSSCRATMRRRRPDSATTFRAFPPIRRPPMRITGWARRCSGSRNSATRRRSSLPPTTTIQAPARHPTCCSSSAFR